MEGGIFGILLGLSILFVAAKVGEEVARRLHLPAVVGELAGGFVVGPHLLALAAPGESAHLLAELGVVILLFQVGLEVRLDDLLAVGRSALAVAVIAMALPILAVLAAVPLLGLPTATAVFIGLALAATSIGITSRVLADFGVLGRPFARVVLGAAVIDDVLALVAIGIAGGATSGNLSASTFLVALAAIGLIVLGFAAARRAQGLPRTVFTWPLFADTPLVPAFIVMLVLALIAGAVGLAAIVGAFVAGLVVAETEARDELQSEIRPLGLIFTPFFFAVTGAQIDLGALTQPGLLAAVAALTLIAIATKVLGGVIGGWSLGRWGALAVGAGMVPRGEVGIVVANLGLVAGVLLPSEFSAVLLAVVLTTVAAPFLLAWVIPRAVGAADPAPG